MPVRSSGCATCRKRRIRCDETRPGCKRCATHGVPCPGYRISQPGGVEFRDVTTFTALKATHQYKQKGYAFDEPPPTKSPSPSISISNSSESPPDSETALTLSSRRSSNSQKEFTTNDLTLARTWTDALLPLSLIAGLTKPPQQLLSTSLMSSQIYSVFLDIYLPKDRTFEHNTFFHEMAIRPNHEPALIRSLNALSLAAVSSARHDAPLMQEAIMEYGRALSTLARTVGKKGYTPSDEILAAVTILSLCEFYDGIKQTGGWAKHQRGAQSMILARGGPKGVNTRLSLLLLANSKHSALPRGLLGRQACFVGKKAYRELMFKAPVVDESTYFYDHALRVPELLERRDKLDFGSPLIISDVDQLLEEFAERELALRTWFAGWAPQNQLTGTPVYEKVPIEEFETFASLVKNRLFETAFRFPSYPFGYLTAMYWCTMHCLRSDTLDLYRMRRNLDDAWEPEEDLETVEADMLQIADNICMCLPYFCEPAASMSGQIGIFLPIGVCGLYYARTQQWKKALWVRDVHENVFVKGMSPPKL